MSGTIHLTPNLEACLTKLFYNSLSIGKKIAVLIFHY